MSVFERNRKRSEGQRFNSNKQFKAREIGRGAGPVIERAENVSPTEELAMNPNSVTSIENMAAKDNEEMEEYTGLEHRQTLRACTSIVICKLKLKDNNWN